VNCSNARFLGTSLLAALVLLTSAATLQGQTSRKKRADQEKEHLIDIIIYREGLLKTPEPKLSEHKHHDVMVYKGEAGTSYGVAFYLMENGTLSEGGWGVQLDSGDYDVVRYRWTNDTTVVLRFLNSATKKAKMFSISGNAKNSTMKVPKTD
jgi:hypothetical protein